MATIAVTWDQVLRELVKAESGCLLTQKKNASRNVEGVRTNVRKRLAAEAGMDPKRRIYATCLDARCVAQGHLTYEAPSVPSHLHVGDGLHNAKQRLQALTEDRGECSIYLPVAGQNRHGRFWLDQASSRIYAHRAAYLLHKGPIAPGLVVRHLCHTPSCVRPQHLCLGTKKDNTHDAIRAERMHWHRRQRGEITALPGSIKCLIPCAHCGAQNSYYKSSLCRKGKQMRSYHFCSTKCRQEFDRLFPGVRWALRGKTEDQIMRDRSSPSPHPDL